MRWRSRPRTLLIHSIGWIVLPFALLIAGLLATGALALQQIITSLLIDRDRQMATLAASSLSSELEGYIRVLEALAGNPGLVGEPAARAEALSDAADALAVFDAGVAVADQAGIVLHAAPSPAFPAGDDLSGQRYFQDARDRLQPAFSSVVTASGSADPLVVIAAPILDDAGRFAGALLGAAQPRTAALSAPVRNLIVGNSGYAYLVGQRGRVISHRDPAVIGLDYSRLPSVARVMAGQSGGLLWQTPEGDRIVEGYAPVAVAGWGLVVRESWDAAAGPAQAYALAAGAAAVLAMAAGVLVAWQGARRAMTPIRLIAEQTRRLALGQPVEPVQPSGIAEIDALEQDFARMAGQLAAYRTGLRRYVGAVTNSQEEERRRISRELHDETVQSLVALSRRIELSQASETDPAKREELGALQDMVRDTVRGVRQISRDLRPLILEDLGLLPALRALVAVAREGAGALAQADFRVTGQPAPLSPQQELALYRITQEALTNIRKHARATSARVTLAFTPGAAQLEIADDGDGFQAPPALTQLAERGSFGLLGIQERVWAAGGSLSIESAPGRGTRLRVSVPVPVTER
jgi:signal transduction histidine kinase